MEEAAAGPGPRPPPPGVAERAEGAPGPPPGGAREEERAPAEAEAAEAEAEAEARKAEGNAAYRAADFAGALDRYRAGLARAPPGSPLAARLHGNCAACHLKLEAWRAAEAACSEALRGAEAADEADGGAAVKNLMRRCTARERLDGALAEEARAEDLQHLEGAVADAQRVLEAEPGNKFAADFLRRKGGELEARRQRQRDEMIGKLKGLGNSILGRFGMSLDNFKAEKDPQTGSYNIRFEQ